MKQYKSRLEFTQNKEISEATRLPNNNKAITILASIWLLLSQSLFIFGFISVILVGNFGFGIVGSFLLADLIFLLFGVILLFWNIRCTEVLEISHSSFRFVRIFFSSDEKLNVELSKIDHVEFQIPSPQRLLNINYSFMGLGMWSLKVKDSAGTNYRLMSRLTNDQVDDLIAWFAANGIKTKK